MRIAFFTDSFFPHVDGVTTYLGAVTRELIKQGHEVMVVAPRWEGVELESVKKFVPRAQVVLVPGVRPFFYPDIKLGTPTPKSMFAVSKFKPEIVHFHTPGFMGVEATALAKLLKVPLLTTFHTYYMEPEGFSIIGIKEDSSAAKALQESLWKVSEQVHAPCDAVIAPTEYVGRDLRSRWKKVKVEVVVGGTKLDGFSNVSRRERLRKKYGLAEGEVVFLSVGRLSVEKHYDSLITSFSMMLMKYPNARLVFVGGGLIQKELEYLVKVLGIEKAVRFIGQIPYDKLVKDNYYAIGDVFVTPSTWDTQGLSIVEAMAAGLPVVAFNYRAMPEVVGRGGVLVKHLDQYGFAKAMGQLAANKRWRAKLGEEAKKQTRKYEIGAHTGKLIALYEKVKREKEATLEKI